ncbi:MAG: hypothetical protein IJ017_08375 [Oscillospiraceae bacterium]|nr:hypothetical protein [Oscillospiraceae bacterium]
MKHIFIVNPGAGQGMKAPELEEKLKKLDIDFEIYETKAAKDATNYVRSRCESGEELRFYACGGDGTIKEVMEGAVGFPNASITCYPVGSGNDFVKCFGGKEKFMDLESLVKGEAKPTDIIKVDDDFCINACHFGLDSAVAKTMAQVKRKKIIGGKNAYITGVVKAFICNMKTKGKIIADGEVIADGEYLLCAVSNGQYVGGMFRCAPKAAVDDGLLEVCLVKPVSRLTFLKLVKYYIEGSHLDNPKFKNILIYRKCKKVEVFAEEGFTASLDGELVETTHFVAEVEPGAVNFAVPCEKVPAEV